MNCSIATDSQIANISGVLSKDVTGVSDNIVKVNGLSNSIQFNSILNSIQFNTVLNVLLYFDLCIFDVLLWK